MRLKTTTAERADILRCIPHDALPGEQVLGLNLGMVSRLTHDASLAASLLPACRELRDAVREEREGRSKWRDKYLEGMSNSEMFEQWEPIAAAIARLDAALADADAILGTEAES